MRQLLLLCLLLPVLACAEDEAAAGSDLLTEAIALNRIHEPELDPGELRDRFDALVSVIRPRLSGAETPREKIAVLNAAILADREVSYLSNLHWRDATLAGALLRGRGNCSATSILYVLVAHELGLPVHLVHQPRHAHARWDDGETRINIETTAGGVERSDAHYLRRGHQMLPADMAPLGMGMSMDDDQLLAVLHFYAWDFLWRAGRKREAVEHLEAALALWPERRDWQLRSITTEATLSGDRQQAAERILELINAEGTPARVITGGLMWLADQAAVNGDFRHQRRILLEAFAQAGKADQIGVLNKLASCHRSLRDWRGAVRYMELAVALVAPGSPDLAGMLYNLAIYRKNDADLPGAIRAIDRALEINPENWHLQVLKAGYLVLSGQTDRGKELFTGIEAPRADRIFWLNMNAWFHSVCADRERFYPAFERCLAAADGPRTFIWIRQDVDLDTFREEERFQELVEQHRRRVFGAGASAEPVVP